MNLDFMVIILFILFVVIVIAPYVWLFNCSYYLKEIDKKISKLLNK